MKIKLDETNSVWNYFGVLADVSETSTMLIIRSDDGQERKMSKRKYKLAAENVKQKACLLYTSPSPRDRTRSRMPSSA